MVGTKEGNLDIIDVGASSRLQSVQAHSGAVWSLAALPDNRYWTPATTPLAVKHLVGGAVTAVICASWS